MNKREKMRERKEGRPTQKRRAALFVGIEMMEMGGIEPPSRNFRREYPTSVVEVLCFAAGTAFDSLPCS